MCCLMRVVGSRCSPWHLNGCKNNWTCVRIDFQVSVGSSKIESFLDINMPAGSSPRDVDALSAKGKGKGKAGVKGSIRDPKEDAKSSCAHCGGRLNITTHQVGLVVQSHESKP